MGACLFVLNNSTCLEVIQAANGVDEAIDHEFGVAASAGGIDAVAGNELAKGFEGGIVVGEEFDEGAGKFSGPGIGGEKGSDPSVVGAQAATGGGSGAMEGADEIFIAVFFDECFVF